jgi:hypothetical protein
MRKKNNMPSFVRPMAKKRMGGSKFCGGGSDLSQLFVTASHSTVVNDTTSTSTNDTRAMENTSAKSTKTFIVGLTHTPSTQSAVSPNY